MYLESRILLVSDTKCIRNSSKIDFQIKNVSETSKIIHLRYICSASPGQMYLESRILLVSDTKCI